MTTSIVDAESVLTIDLGSIHTRVMLYDVVDGEYRFIAAGVVPSTINAPYCDVGEGIHQAIQRLQETTGRAFLDNEARLILPAQPNGAGIDRLVLTFSAGPELRIVTAGLLADVSLASAQHLAASTFGRIIESIGMNDRRRPEAQVDAILRAQPDLVILAGGTENGAGRSVFKLVDLILLVCRLLPQEKRPAVLYAGNQLLAKKVKETLDKWTTIQIAPNVRPGIDIEDLGPTHEVMAQVISRFRQFQLGGLQDISSIASSPVIPTSHAFGRMVRYLSQLYDPNKGVLGVDVGSRTTTVAAALGNEFALNVFPLGMGSTASQVLQYTSLESLMRWLPVHIPDTVVRDYLYQKTLYPASLPITVEMLAIEQALARMALRLAVHQTLSGWADASVAFEPILASGAVLSQSPGPAQTMLMLLDGIQPLGITTVILDQYGLTAGLGAIGKVNSVLPVQVLESGVYLNLGTVISPISPARYGTPIMRVRIDYDESNHTDIEVRQGSLVSLPLRMGQVARLHIDTLRKTDISTRGQRATKDFKIVGGACGAVIDARGRPLILPPDASRRRDLIKKWILTLGG